MELEISKYLLNMNPKNTSQDVLDKRDSALEDLKNEYQKYKDIIDKLLKRRIKYKGPLSLDDNNVDYSCELNFEPLSFSMSQWRGKFTKIIRCNLVIYNLSVIDNGEEKSLRGYMEKIPHQSIPQVMLSNMGGKYIIKNQFDNYAKLIGLGDYELDIKNINDIIFRYDE